jgi:hypothetical protein
MCLHDNVSNIMKTCAIIWNEFNENIVLKNMHKTLQLFFLLLLNFLNG